MPVLTCCAIAVAALMPGQTSQPAAQRDDRLDWWREARFGMFIHWGLYSVPGGRWKGERVDGVGEWIMFHGKIPVDEYEKLAAEFNPTKFRATEWVRIAKDAGMKYIVITTKHHDGFCLFDSKHTDYDIMSTPFRRDIMKELADACRKENIRLCWYYSIMDWHHPDYLPRRAWDTRPADTADFKRYEAYVRNQVEELLTNYGDIGAMWFDGQWEDTWTHEAGLRLYDHCRRLQPRILVNNRVDKGRGGAAGADTAAGFAGDFGTPEQEIPATGIPGVDWETCMTMNNTWGYKIDDFYWKNSTELIRNLIDIASKGGNFLLNVGPEGTGEIPAVSVGRLNDMGDWLRVNSEAIYGTSAGPFKSLDWGRCTQRTMSAGNTRLYLHVFDPPRDGRLTLAGLSNDCTGAYAIKDRQRIKVDRKEDALIVSSFPITRQDAATVVVLDVEGPPLVFDPPMLKSPARVLLDSLEVTAATEASGVDLRYTVDGRDPTAESPTVENPIRIADTTTVSVRAFRGTRPVSPVRRETFYKNTPRPATRLLSARPGLRYEYFDQYLERQIDFGRREPVRRGVVKQFEYSPRDKDEYFAFRYTGYVSVPRDGVYTFALSSDDGGRLAIGERELIDNDGLHTLVEKTGEIALAAGAHPITVSYFNHSGGHGLAVHYAGPGIERQVIPASAISHAADLPAAVSRPASQPAP